MSKEIPTLQVSSDAKSIECQGLKNEHDASLKDFKNISEIISRDTAQIYMLKNQVLALTQQKLSYEKEQTQMRRKQLTATNSKAAVEGTKTEIRNMINAMPTLNPYLLTGVGSVENCFTSSGINPVCKLKVSQY